MEGLEVMETTAIATRETAIQSYSVSQVKAQVQQVQSLMKDLMKEGEHYGHSFEGDTKKNLLKPGADKLMFMFRLRPDFKQEIKELQNGHREVITHCFVYHIETGNKIAEGVGCASTLESKYRYRNAGRVCPHCGKESIIKGKQEYGGGWICFAKKGGCGAKFADNDPAIANQNVGKVENPDIADCYNTILKMSKKRAYVDATITATAASDIFTQDLEDIIHEQKEPRNVTPEQTYSEKLASEADDPELPNKKQTHFTPNEAIIPPEAKELHLLLKDGKLGSFSKHAEKALNDGDLNTVRGILNLYKQGQIK